MVLIPNTLELTVALGHEAAGRRRSRPIPSLPSRPISSPCPLTPPAISSRSACSPRASGRGGTGPTTLVRRRDGRPRGRPGAVRAARRVPAYDRSRRGHACEPAARLRRRSPFEDTAPAMPDPIRAVVFDLDGLMFDTEALFFRVSSEMLAARGKAFTPEIMRAMIGRRAVDAGHVLKTMTGLDEPVEVLLADVRQRFYDEMDTAVHPTPGLFVLLDHLGRKATAAGRGDLVAAVVRRAALEPSSPAGPVPVRPLGRGCDRRASPTRRSTPGRHRAIRRSGTIGLGPGGQSRRASRPARPPAGSWSAFPTSTAPPRH